MALEEPTTDLAESPHLLALEPYYFLHVHPTHFRAVCRICNATCRMPRRSKHHLGHVLELLDHAILHTAAWNVNACHEPTKM